MLPHEIATLNFYHWELRTRGYYIFDDVIEIEPPYVPFSPVIDTNNTIDDGVRKGWLGKLLASPKQEIQEPEYPETVATYSGEIENLTAIELLFPNSMERPPIVMEEVLGLLSYTEESLSFEIIAQNGVIHIRMAVSEKDVSRVSSHLKAFYPNIIIKEVDKYDFDLDTKDTEIGIVDYGLENEGMLSINTSSTYNLDALTSIIATMDMIEEDEFAMFQVIFKGVTAPWATELAEASSDGTGGSFFMDTPYLYSEAQIKVRNPLFAVILRTVVKGNNINRTQYITEQLAKSISIVSKSSYNTLIPLSNEGYVYNDHLRNVFWRTTNRTGVILNSSELAHFVHYPSRNIVSPKLGITGAKTKHISSESLGDDIVIGINEHNGEEIDVQLDVKSRLMHTHIIGATGVGKSTLLANMIIADAEQGTGCALLDPHGDICEDILRCIPKEKINDVIVIDPSDIEFPIGFNILEAKTEAEKIVLSSDMVSAFKRVSTSWGDNMTAVLQNVVNTMLESTRTSTLIEMKRFLIEKDFRNEFLTSVDDPTLHYYWNNEYHMVSKRIAPLLTRIDTFMRPKTIRYMLAQKKGIDLRACMDEGKIVLIKLSQGLIGEENSFMLGAMILAKFNQAAMSRQSLSKEERKPFFVYCDEFQNFVTPSIVKILSGARKYGLGLILAHQELGQISDPQVYNSVISNPYTRISFRLGDTDANKLESGFSYFDQSDLQNLGRGETIMRIGSSSNDFNVRTFPLPEADDDYTDDIINITRQKYGTPRKEVEEMLHALLPKQNAPEEKQSKKTRIKDEQTIVEPIQKEVVEPDDVEVSSEKAIEEIQSTSTILENPIADIPKTTKSFEQQKQEILDRQTKAEEVSKHKSIQKYILQLGQKRNFKVEIEKKTDEGKYIDVVLSNDKISIAIEVSVTNSIDYEVKNLQKCIDENVNHIFMISESSVHLKNIKKLAKESFDSADIKKMKFGTPNDFLTFIDSFKTKVKSSVKQVRGYRVKSNHINLQGSDAEERHNTIEDIILRDSEERNNDT